MHIYFAAWSSILLPTADIDLLQNVSGSIIATGIITGEERLLSVQFQFDHDSHTIYIWVRVPKYTNN